MAALLANPLSPVFQYDSNPQPHANDSHPPYSPIRVQSPAHLSLSPYHLSNSVLDRHSQTQLPKGASPPLLPSTRHVLDHKKPANISLDPPSHFQPQATSIWKIQLPALSKVVRWARPPRRPSKKTESTVVASIPEDSLSSDQKTFPSNGLAPEVDKPLPPITAFDPPLPLSPKTQSTHDDEPSGSPHQPSFLRSEYRAESYISSAHGSFQVSSSSSSRLDMLHDSSGSQIEIVTSSSKRVKRRQHQPHYQRRSSAAYSNQGHDEFSIDSGGHEAYTDLGHSALSSMLLESEPDHNFGPRRPYSDIGHGRDMSGPYLNGSPGSTSSSTRRRRLSFFERISHRKEFNASAPVLSLSEQLTTKQSVPPLSRKLLKSQRSASEASDLASFSTPPSSFKFPLRFNRISNPHMSPTEASISPPSRKLTKRPPNKRTTTSSRINTSTELESTPFIPQIDGSTIIFPSKKSVSGSSEHSVLESPTVPSNGQKGSDVAEKRIPKQSAVNPRPKRQSFLRTESNRRWTMAMAEASEELFVAELDRLRRMGMRAGEVHGVIPFPSDSIISDMDSLGVGEANIPRVNSEPDTSEVWAVVSDLPEDEEEWMHARRALLCCRELVLTERTYEENLQRLADGETSDPVPPLLQQYIPALVSASKTLSSYFNEDPSAIGVSAAFIGAEEQLEAALVAWCGVVGEIFIGPQADAIGSSRLSSSTNGLIVQQHELEARSSPLDISAKEESSGNNDIERLIIPQRTLSLWKRPTSLVYASLDPIDKSRETRSRKKSSGSKSFKEKEQKRKPRIRELAIQPTQRVTRYVLLYKDLLKHTPMSSPAHSLVKRAMDCAIRIAGNCDRAQGNSAFLIHS